MSNPDPNLPPDLKRESRRHIGPLLGMAPVVIFGVGMILWWLADDVAQSPQTEGGAGMTDEQAMEPPASPGEGGVEDGGAAGGTSGTEDAVGDPVPDEDLAAEPRRMTGQAQIDGRLIALRKMLALALSRLPEAEVTALLERETLNTGDEDPAALPDAITAEAGAMAAELAALRDEVALLRGQLGRGAT